MPWHMGSAVIICITKKRKERKENNLIYNIIKKNKILGINLNKDAKCLYATNYKTLLQETK